MKNEGTEHLAHNGEIKEKVDSVAVDDVDDGHLESSNDREINENTDNLDNSSEDSFQGNQIDVPSLEELSAETDEDARADTSEKVVPSVSESVEDAFGVSEQRKEEQETQGRNDRELINLFFIDNQTDDDVLKKSNLRFFWSRKEKPWSRFFNISSRQLFARYCICYPWINRLDPRRH